MLAWQSSYRLGEHNPHTKKRPLVTVRSVVNSHNWLIIKAFVDQKLTTSVRHSLSGWAFVLSLLEASGWCGYNIWLTDGYISGRHRPRTEALWSIVESSLTRTLDLKCSFITDTLIPWQYLSFTNSISCFSGFGNCADYPPPPQLALHFLCLCNTPFGWHHFPMLFLLILYSLSAVLFQCTLAETMATNFSHAVYIAWNQPMALFRQWVISMFDMSVGYE